jgi:hypothetical protein
VKPVILDVAHLAAPQLSAIFGLQRVGALDGRTAVTVLTPLLDDIPVTECQFAFDHYHWASRKNPNPHQVVPKNIRFAATCTNSRENQADSEISGEGRDTDLSKQPGLGQVSMLKEHFVSRCSRIVPLVTSSGHSGCSHSMRAVLRIKQVAVGSCFTSAYTAFHFKPRVSSAGVADIPKVGTLSVPALQVPHRLPIPILTDVALDVVQERAQPLDLVVGVPNQQGAIADRAPHGPSLGSRSRRPRLISVLCFG